MSDIHRADPRLKEWVSAPKHEFDAARQTMDAWNRGEVERFIADFAPDCDWYPTTVGGLVGESTPIRGHEGLRAFAREADELWENRRLEVADLLARGRFRLWVGRWRARGRSSGVDIDTPMFWLSERNADGKSIWAKSFVDLDHALAAAAERRGTSGSRAQD